MIKVILISLITVVNLTLAQVQIAPNGFYTWKNGIYDSNGDRHIFRGFNYGGFDENKAGLCYGVRNCGIDPNDFTIQAQWGANIVRIPLNQTWWVNEESVSGAWFSKAGLPATTNYRVMIDKIFELAKEAGLTVIADCHRGEINGSIDKLIMGNTETQIFWDTFSEQYKDDGQILFELLNEPRQITNEEWMNGGNGYVGMSTLYNTIRENNAHNLILIGGNDYAYDIRGIKEFPLPLDGYNIMIVSHTYGHNFKTVEHFDERFGFTHNGFTANNGSYYQYPVIFTEFGYLGDNSTDLAHTASVIQYAEENNMSWIPWSWVGPYYRKHNMFDEKYNADPTRTPNGYGSLFRDSLAYLKNKPMPARHSDAPFPDDVPSSLQASEMTGMISINPSEIRIRKGLYNSVNINLFSIFGKKISTIYNGQNTGGEIHWDSSELSPAVYVITIQIDGEYISKKFTVVE